PYQSTPLELSHYNISPHQSTSLELLPILQYHNVK
ncbi:unnamed protein product, partial [Heterotrigona itama]